MPFYHFDTITAWHKAHCAAAPASCASTEVAVESVTELSANRARGRKMEGVEACPKIDSSSNHPTERGERVWSRFQEGSSQRRKCLEANDRPTDRHFGEKESTR